MNVGFNGEIAASAVYSTVKTREVDFEYNHNGLRTKKVVTESGVKTTTEYIYHGKLITHLIQTAERPNEDPAIEELHFFYDANSRPAFVEYGGVKYRYILNLQGDIVAIVDASGNLVVEYKYDVWGQPFYEAYEESNPLCLLGDLNPFRYRGYVWDAVTKCYYLRNRYYNIDFNRFVNLDCAVYGASILSTNLISYCANNPVLLVDPSGQRHEISAGVVGIPSMTPVEYFAVNYSWKDVHYNRNTKNTMPSNSELLDIVNGRSADWIAVPDKYNAYHRFVHGPQGNEAIYNKKYMSPDGTKEVIICYDKNEVPTPYIVTDPNNAGTYNYGPGTGAKHFFKDVLPYWVWGNCEEDTTSLIERIAGDYVYKAQAFSAAAICYAADQVYIDCFADS